MVGFFSVNTSFSYSDIMDIDLDDIFDIKKGILNQIANNYEMQLIINNASFCGDPKFTEMVRKKIRAIPTGGVAKAEIIQVSPEQILKNLEKERKAQGKEVE